MTIVLHRAQRFTRQLFSNSWADDRILQTLAKTTRAIIIFDDPADLPEINKFRNSLPDATIRLYQLTANNTRINNVEPIENIDTLHTHLRRQPNPRLIIDLLHDPHLKTTLLRQCLYYLKKNGIYLSAHLDEPTLKPVRQFIKNTYALRRKTGFNENAQAAIQKVGAIAEREPEGAVATQRLAAAITYLRMNKHYAILRKQFTHLLKVRDTELDTSFILDRNLDWAQDHIRQPEGLYLSKATLHLNHPRFANRFPKAFNLPPLRVREYDDVTCLRREALYRGGLFLPDTFRLTGQKYLRNVTLQDVDINFALPGKQPKPGKLTGHYYHLDTEYPNVYGHLLTDMIGRLWAWRDLKAQHPDLRVLISDRADKHDLPTWVRTMLNAYGINDEDIVLLHKPMKVEKLYAPTPQFVNYQNGYVHPGLLKVWAELRDNLTRHSTATDLPKKIFVSRVVDQHRLCRNRDEVEQYFTDRGFSVLRPETLPQPDQVALFSNATHIAGYGGSAMLTGIFSNGQPKKRLIINPWTHHPINEYLISSMYGDDITYLYQEPEITKANETKPQEAFHSPYTFDFENARPLLEQFIKD